METNINVTVALPESFSVAVRDGRVECAIDLTALSPEIIARLALHGLKQKLADSAVKTNVVKLCVAAITGNKREGESKDAFLKREVEAAKQVSDDEMDNAAQTLMDKVRDNLLRGDWGAERTGSGADDLDMDLIKYVMATWPSVSGEGKAAEKYARVNAWLDAKDGRRDAVRVKLAEHRKALAEI